MAKKKKNQLKPVARPFATASVPKKAGIEEEAPDDDPTSRSGGRVDAKESPDAAEGDSSERGRAKIANVEGVSEEVKALKVEEATLQALVDKLQDKTEKEITRAIKVHF
jgi:ATP-dependent RNA helicase DHX29